MNRNQANRARIAERAASRPTRTPIGVGINPAARVITPVSGTGRVRKSRAVKMTGAQRDSTGRWSDWNASPDFFTDPKWSATVGDFR